MRTRRVYLFLFAAALLTAFGCSDDGDVPTTTPAFACLDGGAASANAVSLGCGGASADTQRVDIVIGGPAAVSGLSFNVMFDGSKLAYDSYDATPANDLFPGALVSVVESTEPNSTPGFKDVVVAIQMTGGTALTGDPGQHLVLSLSFQRASGATFDPSPLSFNVERTLTATPASAGTTFGSSLTVAYR